MSRILTGGASRNFEEWPNGQYFYTENYGFGRVYSVPDPDPKKEFMGSVHIEFTDQDSYTVQDPKLDLMPDFRMADQSFVVYAINEAMAKLKYSRRPN